MDASDPDQPLITRYEYNTDNKLIRRIDPSGKSIAYVYDNEGRLASIDYFTASDHNPPQMSVTFTYDASGNLTGYNDGVTSAVYAYDAASRKIAETVNVGPFSKTIGYTYYPPHIYCKSSSLVYT